MENSRQLIYVDALLRRLSVVEGVSTWQLAAKIAAQAMQKQCAILAAHFLEDPYALHPNIRFDQMNDSAKIAAHSTAQLISLAISKLSFPSMEIVN